MTGITGIRIELLTDASLPNNGPGRNPANGNFVLTEFKVDQAVPEVSTTASLALGVMVMAGFHLIRRRNRRR